MIFGTPKTAVDHHRAEQIATVAKIRGVKRFAIITKLDDGRWAFFQTVWRYYKGYYNMAADTYGIMWTHPEGSPMYKEYADRDIKHINLQELRYPYTVTD